MRFEAVNPKDIVRKTNSYRATKPLAVLNEFINSEIPMAKIIIDNGEYKNFNSAQAAIKQAVRRFHVDGINASVINGNLYLINTILMDKEVSL